MKKILLSVIFVFSIGTINAQKGPNVYDIKKEADNFYGIKNYKSAIKGYLKVIELTDFKSQKIKQVRLCSVLESKTS